MNATRFLRASPRAVQRLRLARPYSTKPADPAPPHPHPPTQPPPPPQKTPSRVGTFYRNNTYPVLKSFLLALFTYQLAYYVWLRLEVVEEKSEQQGTIRDLEEEVKKAVARQKRAAVDPAQGVADAADHAPRTTKSKGWLW